MISLRDLTYAGDANRPLPQRQRQLPPTTQTTTQASTTTASSTAHPPIAITPGSLPGNVQINPDGTAKGVSALPIDPNAPTKLDQSLIQDFSKLLGIVQMFGGTYAEAYALYTTPGTWSNVDLTVEEASAAKLESLTPTEYAVRKGLRAYRDAVVTGVSPPNGTIIVKPPDPAPVPKPTTTPLPITPAPLSIFSSSSAKTAAVVVGVAAVLYLMLDR